MFLLCLLCLMAGMAVVLALKTAQDLRPLPADLLPGDLEVRKPQIVDRAGNPLSISHQNRWSVQTVALHEIPPLLRNAFIESEDRRFFSHGGVDWPARLHALAQNLRAMKAIRGASTITEQAVRMLHPRPRTIWSRWLEGIEAARLEKRFPKSAILEFYLNQVPYGHQRRGVVEAARFYFDRDPATLNVKESLALAVLVRAPSGLDLRQNPKAIEKRLTKLAAHLRDMGLIGEAQYRAALSQGFEFAKSDRAIEAPQFVRYVLNAAGIAELPAKPVGPAAGVDDHAGGLSGRSGPIAPNAIPPPPRHGVSGEILNINPGSRSHRRTSLDGCLQEKVRQILRSRLEALKSSDVGDGAALAVDNRTGEVLAWVSESLAAGESQGWVDAVLVRRQPGSTLKPFLYALAIEMGWTAATLIDDSPLAEAAGSGLHSFRNYSRTCYGPVRLRVALGNSLNIPAVRTIGFTGVERFLERLRSLCITGLNKPAEFYGHGLALGDGEVSLFELVQAYSALPRHGVFLPLRVLSGPDFPPGESTQVIDPAASAIIGDILSDPQARRLEFGEGHLLRFPVQTAVKTGTSTDHRDSWAVGFSERYTAGVWMGNLDRRPTRGVSGAIGPALVLRAIFAELDRNGETGPLSGWPGLQTVGICSVSGKLAGPGCPKVDEKFSPGTVPAELCAEHMAENGEQGDEEGLPSPDLRPPRLLQPTPGLQIALDPRVPVELRAFAFRISQKIDTSGVQWIVNGKLAGETGKGEHRFLWPLSRGEYVVFARVRRAGQNEPVETPPIAFEVK